jgi:hypothetical protein
MLGAIILTKDLNNNNKINSNNLKKSTITFWGVRK